MKILEYNVTHGIFPTQLLIYSLLKLFMKLKLKERLLLSPNSTTRLPLDIY